MTENMLNDKADLTELINEANELQRHLGLSHLHRPFGIRRPRRLVEGKAGKWVIHQPSQPNRGWTLELFLQHLDDLRDRAQRHQQRVDAIRRMDDLNARVRELLGDEDFGFYTSRLIGCGSPRG